MTPNKKIYFISDLHLGSNYAVNSLDRERKVVKWLDSVKESALEIYLMGDILDYWYEYKYVVPRGYVRFLGKIAELSDAGVKIHWFIGNHDIWIFDYLPNELGIEVVDGSVVRDILGKRFFLTHGDGVGKHKRSFSFIRSIFRNKFCQLLYSAIHPRWTIPFAHGWSNHSRQSGMTENLDHEINNIKNFTKEYAAAHDDIDYFVYGHLHILSDEKVGKKAHMIVLGDWITHNSYAEFDGDKMVLCRYDGM